MNGNWSDYEKFLKPVHLKGEPRTLTITRITEEETHPRPGETVRSPVLWFKEVPFGLILSPTNRQTLIALYGDEKNACIGKPIVVKAIDMKVGGRDKQPLRIQKQRPNAPQIDPATGEIHAVLPPVVEPPAPQAAETNASIVYPQQPERMIEEPKRGSELDAFFGPNPRKAEPAPSVLAGQWPTNEAEFLAWLKAQSINGKDTRAALGTDAKSWLKMNAGKTYADVAQTIVATLGK